MTIFSALFSLWACSARAAVPLSRAPALDFRIELGRERYLLRIPRAQLERVSEALAFGRPLPAGDALVVSENRYPPLVSRRIPPELARRATALWRFVEDRGWTGAAGVEWDPRLGRAASPAPAPMEGLRDAPADEASRAGVWAAEARVASFDRRSFGVRCVEPLTGPSRCYRVWKASEARRRGKTTP